MSFGVWQVRPKAPNNCSTHTPFTVGPETSFALHVILSAGLACGITLASTVIAA